MLTRNSSILGAVLQWPERAKQIFEAFFAILITAPDQHVDLAYCEIPFAWTVLIGVTAQMKGEPMVGVLGFAILVWLVEMFAFRQLPPDERAFKTVFVAYILASLLSFFIRDFYWEGWFLNAPPAFVFWLWFRHRLRKRWNEESHSDAGVFD